jgi:V/A-type H+-transporting ATPase subunit G/H
LSADIKELQELIDRERAAEEKVRKAKEEAQAIVKQAREKAESMVRAIESDPCWEKLKQARNDEIARKKAEIEEEYKRKTSALEKVAQENFEKAIERIFEETLRGKL